MKVLCKKNNIWSHRYKGEPAIETIFEEGKFYELRVSPAEDYLGSIEHDNGGIYPFSSEYFYTPEETINLMRTELIDKILK